MLQDTSSCLMRPTFLTICPLQTVIIILCFSPLPNNLIPPSLVFEVAVRHENRERLLADASEKYIHPNTSVACWFGVKVDIANNVFWAGWGGRANHGFGLRLEQPTEDHNGVSAFLPVNPPAPILGQFTIPSALVFRPVALPQNAPVNFVIPLEQIRSAIVERSSLM